MGTLILIGIGLIVLILVGVLVFALFGGRLGGDEVAQKRLDEFVGGIIEEEEEERKREEKKPSKLTKSLDETIEKRGWGEGIKLQLAQANLKITPTEYIMLVFISIVSTGALAFLIYKNLPLTLGGAVLGFFLPRFYLGMRKRKRLK
ncbi:MAG: hypothetical protein D6796_10075, partial [Caldilineae bacterium]